jgi:hypothetical protein
VVWIADPKAADIEDAPILGLLMQPLIFYLVGVYSPVLNVFSAGHHAPNPRAAQSIFNLRYS